MKEIRFIGILILDRIKESGRTQQLFSKYSNIIRTRLGTHEVSEAKCSRNGVIILELSGNPEIFNQFENDLNEIGGIQHKKMSFII